MFRFRTLLIYGFGKIFFLLFLIESFCGETESIAQTNSDFRQYQGKIVRKITFSGKFKLKKYYLFQEIDTRSNSPLDADLLLRDQKKIDGLGIFSLVRPEVTAAGDSVDIDFELKEIWTLTPMFSAGRTDNKLDWLVGAHERDLLGYFFNARGYYRRFEGENTYVFTGVFPRAFRKDVSIGIGLVHERQSDPLVYQDTSINYHYLNKSLYLSLGVRASEKIYPSVFFGYGRENWRLEQSEHYPLGAPVEIDYPRYETGASLSLGRIYSNHYYYDGVMITATGSLIRELPYNRFDRWRTEFAGYAYAVTQGFNFCFRGQYLRSSGLERVMPYALSGESNVRGFGDKYARGDQLLGANGEVRRKVIETKRWYSQAAAFVDAASLWGRDRTAADGLANLYWSVGGGLRISYKQYPKLGRLDFAFNTKTLRWSYYLGTTQFF